MLLFAISSRSGPITTATPAKPSAMPTVRSRVMRSSTSTMCASGTTKSGIAAFRIAASEESICCSPHGIKTNGIALESAPCTSTSPQRRGPSERSRRPAKTSTKRPPPPSRSQATASGPISSSITLMSMNDAPQIRESTSRPISCGVRTSSPSSGAWARDRG